MANSVKDNRDKGAIQVITRAVAILRSLEHEADGLSLGELAKHLNLPRSTVQRIVGALTAESLVVGASPTSKVKLGPGLLRLAASVDTSMATLARPHMVAMARDLGETVDLSTLARKQAVFIDQAIGGHREYSIAAVAVQLPLHCTANGKAMLAMLSDEEILRRIGRTYARKTEHTLTSFDTLLKDLEIIRRTGIAITVEENALGVCAVGVAFHDEHGNCMALSVPVPAVRFAETRVRISRRLNAVKLELQRQLHARY